MLYGLKLGKMDRKNMPKGFELFIGNAGLFGLEQIFMESLGGKGSKLSTGPLES